MPPGRLLRIALLASAASLHTRRWASWLALRGHTVRVFSDASPPPGTSLAGAERTAPQWTWWRKLVAFKIVGGRYANSRDKWRAYSAALHAFAPDIVHAMEAVNYGPSLVHFPGYARVLTPWGRDIESLAWPDLDPERRRLVLAGCAAADVITTNGPGIEDHWAALMNVPRERLHFFPWGIDTAVFRPTDTESQRALRTRLGLPTDARLVVSPRRADPYYGVGELIDAWQGLETDAHLVVLRGGVVDDHWRAVSALAARVPRTHLVDSLLTPHDMAMLLGAAHVVAMAPRTDLLACTLLEAMACGAVPVVAPNVVYRAAMAPLNAEAWPQDCGVGIIANGHDAESLRKALREALAMSPEGHLHAVDHNVATMARCFDFDLLAPRLEEVYRQALALRPLPSRVR